MTRDQIRAAILEALTTVAPEIDPATVQADSPFRLEYELDSMDFLNFVIALHADIGVDVPESDYPKLATLDGAVAYLSSRLGV